MKSSELHGVFIYALAILFIALKLTGHITWSWVWVLSPLWVPLALVVVIVTVWVVILGIRNKLK